MWSLALKISPVQWPPKRRKEGKKEGRKEGRKKKKKKKKKKTSYFLFVILFVLMHAESVSSLLRIVKYLWILSILLVRTVPVLGNVGEHVLEREREREREREGGGGVNSNAGCFHCFRYQMNVLNRDTLAILCAMRASLSVTCVSLHRFTI